MLPESPKSKLRKMIRQYLREQLEERKIVTASDVSKKFGLTREESIKLLSNLQKR